jgi:hypothetical protein
VSTGTKSPRTEKCFGPTVSFEAFSPFYAASIRGEGYGESSRTFHTPHELDTPKEGTRGGATAIASENPHAAGRLIGKSCVGDPEPSRADDMNPKESVRTG